MTPDTLDPPVSRVTRAAFNFVSERRDSIYLKELCDVVEARLQSGSQREVLEYLTGALNAHFPETPPHPFLVEGANVVDPQDPSAEYDRRLTCVVRGRSDVVLGFQYVRPKLFDRWLIVLCLITVVLVVSATAIFTRILLRFQRFVAFSFEETLLKKMRLGRDEKGPQSFLARVLDVEVPMVSMIHERVGRLEAKISEQAAVILLKERDTAVAQTVQMLAHDVRRPFTSLKMATMVLRGAKDDPQRLAKLLDRLEFERPQD